MGFPSGRPDLSKTLIPGGFISVKYVGRISTLQPRHMGTVGRVVTVICNPFYRKMWKSLYNQICTTKLTVLEITKKKKKKFSLSKGQVTKKFTCPQRFQLVLWDKYKKSYLFRIQNMGILVRQIVPDIFQLFPVLIKYCKF